MTHPHLDQCSFPVYQHPMVFSPYCHLVNAPASPLESRASTLIPRHYYKSPTVVDGEVITSSVTTRVLGLDDTGTTTGHEPKRSLLQRALEDPYWVLLTLAVALGLSITATVVYGVIQIILALSQWFGVHGATLGSTTVLIVVLMLCGGTTAAKCTGIHCGGCKG